jgi:hypothetical protein
VSKDVPEHAQKETIRASLGNRELFCALFWGTGYSYALRVDVLNLFRHSRDCLLFTSALDS